MGILVVLMLTFVVECLAVPKPMESITNYNVMMVRGAYGKYNDKGKIQGFEPGDYSQAVDTTARMGRPFQMFLWIMRFAELLSSYPNVRICQRESFR